MGAIEGSRTGVILRKVGAAAWRNPSMWKEVAEGLLALVDTESKMAGVRSLASFMAARQRTKSEF